MTPGPAFVLQLFANLVSCFSIWVSYLSSSSFSLETAITFLRERYKVKQRKVGPKREWQMWKCHRSHEGLSTPFYTLRFWTAPVLPRARYASTQQTSRSRRQKKYALSFSINPIFRRGFSKRTLLISNKIASHCRSAF